MRRNDQVFQLSLTEVAFTLAFILMLLLGYQLFKEGKEQDTAQKAINAAKAADQANAAMSGAYKRLYEALAGASRPDIDEVIQKLISAENARQEQERLKANVEDLDAQLSALTEIRDAIGKVEGGERSKEIIAKVDEALKFRETARGLVRGDARGQEDTQSKPPESDESVLEILKRGITTNEELHAQVQKQLNREIPRGSESQAIADIVAAAKTFESLSDSGVSVEAVQKQNSDLRGQIAFLRNRLEARGGRDYPPCWADEKTGRVEFLFSVELTEAGANMAPAWPAYREKEALALPGIAEILSGAPIPIESFGGRVRRIFDMNRDTCRHYVLLRSSIAHAVQSDRARLLVENFFYKVEVRR